MSFFYVKHDVQLAHVFEILIQCLYQIMNELQECQLVLREKRVRLVELGGTYDILIIVHADNEVQGGVSTIDHFVLSVVQETTLILRATQAFSY